MLFPIHEKVLVSVEILKMLSEDRVHHSDSFAARVVSDSDCRINLQLYINSVEKELLKGVEVDTNITYGNYREQYFDSTHTDERHILVAYLISYIIEYIQVGPLSKNKIKIVKNILRKFNKNYHNYLVYFL